MTDPDAAGGGGEYEVVVGTSSLSLVLSFSINNKPTDLYNDHRDSPVI